MTLTREVKTGELAELLKQVKAGNEVVLTEDQMPVAKLTSTELGRAPLPAKFEMRSIKGPKVLTPNISNAEIADEMFGQK